MFLVEMGEGKTPSYFGGVRRHVAFDIYESAIDLGYSDLSLWDRPSNFVACQPRPAGLRNHLKKRTTIRW